jgi:hypothetical protein
MQHWFRRRRKERSRDRASESHRGKSFILRAFQPFDTKSFSDSDFSGSFPVFGYNSATLGGKCWFCFTWKISSGNEKAQTGVREKNTHVISSHVLSPGVALSLGGYVDDGNPSASE